jgi:hypothetical protein
MAVGSLLTISRDEDERARLMALEKRQLDWQSMQVESRRRMEKAARIEKAARKEMESTRKEMEAIKAHYEPIVAEKDDLLSRQAAQIDADKARIAELERQLKQTKAKK